MTTTMTTPTTPTPTRLESPPGSPLPSPPPLPRRPPRSTRCDECHKKTCGVGVDCVCGKYYCLFHGFQLSHNCDKYAEFLQSDKKKLADTLLNGKVTADKLTKI